MKERTERSRTYSSKEFHKLLGLPKNEKITAVGQSCMSDKITVDTEVRQ